MYISIGGSSADPSSEATPMPVIKTNMYNQGASRAEAAAALDRAISKLEDDMRKLKNEFDIYFNGAQKRPPLEARARVDSQIRRISDNRSLSYAQRYQLNSLVAKYSSYRELWRRNMRARGEELI
jgi:hypothetical protein